MFLNEGLFNLDVSLHGDSIYGIYESSSKLALFTILFLTFVFMQAFNFIASLVIQDRASALLDLRTIVALIFSLGVAVVVIVYGGHFMRTARLSGAQVGLAALFGATQLVSGLILYFIPRRCFESKIEDVEEVDDREFKRQIN